MIDKDFVKLSDNPPDVLKHLLDNISTTSLAEESEKLGVDIIDMVNRNFRNLLLNLDDEKSRTI